MAIVDVDTDLVLNKTGVTVTDQHISNAVFVIETYTGLDLSADIAKTRDYALLTSAVIWQAAYLQQHGTRIQNTHDVASSSANGVSISFFDRVNAEDGMALSPLASRCLKRLSSNKRVSTLHSTPERAAHAYTDPEDALTWQRLPGVWNYR